MVSRESAKRSDDTESDAHNVSERVRLQRSDTRSSGTDVSIRHFGEQWSHEHVNSIPEHDRHGHRDDSSSDASTVNPRRRPPSAFARLRMVVSRRDSARTPRRMESRMRYQNRYPKTMTGAEIRILNRWQDPIDGLGVNGGRSRPASDRKIKTMVASVKSQVKESRRARRQDQD